MDFQQDSDNKIRQIDQCTRFERRLMSIAAVFIILTIAFSVIE